MKIPASAILIDNNETDNSFNKRMLEETYGIEVISFNNAITALLHLRSTEVRYDILLINFDLPVMDGFEFINSYNLSNLHKKHGKMCFLSSSTDTDHKKKAYALNIDFIEKPLTIEKIETIL